jgi:hypothetical protein
MRDRMRSRYEKLGVLLWKREKAAPELAHREIMEKG